MTATDWILAETPVLYNADSGYAYMDAFRKAGFQRVKF
jgi:hypothetical protein